MGNDVVDFGCRQRAGIGGKHLVIVGRMVAEIAADRNDPAVLGLIQDHAVAPVWSAAGDDDRQLAVEIGRTAAIDPRGVADSDLDPLLFRLGETKTLEPGRARGAAAGGIDHEVGRDGLLGAVADLDADALDGGPGVIRNQALHRAVLDHAHIRQRRQPPPHMAFQHRTRSQ